MAFLRDYPRAIKVAALCGSGFLLLGIALHILCLATPYYFILFEDDAKEVLIAESQYMSANENTNYSIHYGLWMICVGNATHEDLCYRMTKSSGMEVTSRDVTVTAPDWLTAPRALSIIGLILAAMGVFSLVAFVLTRMKKLPYLFLGTATGACVLGGILILSGDIAFVAENTTAFYAENHEDNYFFPGTKQMKSYLVQKYDNRITAGWGFILDLISGALIILCGPVFTFIALKLQWREHLQAKQALNEASHSHKDITMTSRF